MAWFSERKPAFLKTLAAAAVLVLLAVGIAAWQRLAYPVLADNSNLAEYADRFLRRGDTLRTSERIALYGSVTVGGQKFVLAEINGQLGRIKLAQGPGGTYRISQIGYGGGNFRTDTARENGQCFLVIGGRNKFFGIRTIEVNANGKTYAMDVPEGDHFLVSAELDDGIDRPLPGDLQFYDAAGEDITGQVPWN